MPIQMGPCDPWPTRLCCDVEGKEPEEVARWTLVASQILFSLSGRRIGPCPVTVRPCRRACLESASFVSFQTGTGTGPWIPYVGVDGMWRNASVCGCRSDCSCGELCEVYLPGPVYDVTEVNVDGQVLAPEQYRVDAPGRLVRVGGGCWPDCQDMAAPPGDPDTFAVAYRIGLPVDEAAIAAVSELTCHLLKGCGGSESCGCNANRNIVRYSRQGVDLEMPDPQVVYSQGRTGLPIVDAWLMAVNPNRLDSPSRVYSPDFRQPRVQQWP
ncbi:hypothetical protein PV387_03355 [Streptomyces sp. ME02-6987-2C]|uniref:hypothetical protein n=1 Tax=unclassified Streptomyces TaxID=2593676 RepID=UPI0029B65A3D|nr:MULTISPECIES: hypothetical protein [unclassified Streptomyces]MDX3345876.1 hypothetical protein [Streptomyces sp. ME02-6979A]MDX3365071.1 hypothetical protein [Streptomyces sp. ME02-6987-2C]MDX3404874.1 hypothetical protein [Streptomyces sp. ME02-6977A]MDX3421642.1 hypothetical protein [Streptomyces sp. ME02-6985-2c]